MRIGTQTIVQQGLTAMLEQQSRIARTQQQLASGRKDAVAADNPSDVAAALGLDEALSMLDRYRQSGDIVLHRLGLEEQALTSVSDTIQRVRELAVQANNATQSDASRQAIVAELQQRLQQLAQFANADDGQGRYLFAGGNSSTPPFSLTAGGFSYAGDASVRSIAVGPGVDVADGDSGRRVFMEIPDGNGTFAVAPAAANTGTGALSQTAVVDPTLWDGGSYTIEFTSASAYEVRDGGGALVTTGSYAAGQPINFNGVQVVLEGAPAGGDAFTVAASARGDLFSIVQDLVGTLSAPGGSAATEATRRSGVYNSLQNLDRALDHLLTLRAGVGARMGMVADSQASQESLSVQLQQSLSEVRDTNFTEAVSRMQLELTALQAAQQTFSKVQGLSLFDYIR